MSCSTLTYVSVTPDFLLQYHNSSLGTLPYAFCRSTMTQFQFLLTFSALLHQHSKSKHHICRALCMKPYCRSLIITSRLSLASGTLSHSLMVWLMNFIPLQLLQHCRLSEFLKNLYQQVFSPLLRHLLIVWIKSLLPSLQGHYSYYVYN